MKEAINLHFAAPVMYKADLVGDNERNKVVNFIKSESKNENISTDKRFVGGINTTLGISDLEKEEFLNVRMAMIGQVQKFVQELTGKQYDISEKSSWWNISKKGVFHDQHIHPQSHVSAVWYADCYEDSSQLVFANPYSSMFPIVKSNSSVADKVFYKPMNDSIIIFESHLPHFTEVEKGEKERITIAANYVITNQSL